MPAEPTPKQRQQMAFGYLREQARNAHIAGDGLLVNLLCNVALDQINKLTKEKSFQLDLQEVVWIPIFEFYWLVSPHEHYFVTDAFSKIERNGPEDALIYLWLEKYGYLIGQPLDGNKQIFADLSVLQWPKSWIKPSLEIEILIIHILELVWFRSANQGEWEKISKIWGNAAAIWIREYIKKLRERLIIQTRLVLPNKKYPILEESFRDKLRQQSDFGELWLLHLHGRGQEVCKIVEKMMPFVSGDTHQWRVLGDFSYINHSNSRDESDNVHLARRRKLSAETPLLLFHDKREQRIDATLGELFRSRRQGMASKRWEVFILSMLHELSALRLWDIGMWRDAIKFQSEGILESTQWQDQPEFAVLGLELAIHASATDDVDRDALLRKSIDKLEFASHEVLKALSDAILATYPVQKHSAVKLLDDITDLFPESTWPELAHWTVKYAREADEHRTRGVQINPAGHWYRALPIISKDSPVWQTLQPLVVALAGISHCWSGEPGNFLTRWLRCAPIPFVKEVCEVLLAHPEENHTVSIERAELLIDCEEWRPEFHNDFTKRLAKLKKSSNEALQLAKHLNSSDFTAKLKKHHDRLVLLINETIQRADPLPGAKQTPFNYVLGVDLIDEWKLEDMHLLEALTSAVNSTKVRSIYLPWLLNTIQLLVANGPIEFAQYIQSHVRAWTKNLPKGYSENSDKTGPFSIVQFEEFGADEIALAVGWLAFQLPRKLGPVANIDLLSWAKEMLLLEASKPLEMVVYASALVALEAPKEAIAEPLSLMETALLSLWKKAGNEVQASTGLATALSYLSSIFGIRESNSASWPRLQDFSIEEILILFNKFLPIFSKTPRSRIRAEVAKLLFRISRRHQLSQDLSQTWEDLTTDRRARVRFETQGGWESLRNRKSKSPE